jgi:hypothetical protein
VLLARVGLAVDRLDAYQPHQRAHVSAADLAQHAAAGKRPLKVQLVDAAHQFEVSFADRHGVVVRRAPAQAQQFGLPLDRQLMVAVDLSSPIGAACPPSAVFSFAEPLLGEQILVFKSGRHACLRCGRRRLVFQRPANAPTSCGRPGALRRRRDRNGRPGPPVEGAAREVYACRRFVPSGRTVNLSGKGQV